MNYPPRISPAQNLPLTRRGFLTTTAVAGSAAALGVLGGGGMAAASTQVSRRLTASKGVKGRIGSTVGSFLYEGTTTRMGAASVFDGYVSSAAGAAVIQKYYFAESKWLSKPLPPDVTQLPAQYPNFKWIMCFRPSLDLTSADQNNLKRSCNLLTEAGINFDVVLWQEPNGPNSTVFPTAADYQKYFYFYAPYIPSGVEIIYISCSSAHPQDQQDYFPSQGSVHKIYYDFYGNVYAAAHWKRNNDPLSVLEQIADENGLPFGLGEWGFGTTQNDRLTMNTNPTAAAFVDYIIEVFSNRLDEGKTNGDLLYFDGRSSVDTQNLIASADDWKVPLYQRLYSRLGGADGAGVSG
jgi:hypothetical protein